MRDPKTATAIVPCLFVFLVLCQFVLCQAPARAQDAAGPSPATAGPLTPVVQSSKAAQRKPVKHTKTAGHFPATAKASTVKTSKAKSSTEKTAIDTSGLAAPAAAAEPTPQLKHAPAPKESPISVNARWSATNAPNYGLNSTTTQNDLLRRDQGETTSTPIDQVGVGLDLKF